MDRIVTARINGEEYTLNYSIAVMFDMIEKYGTISEALNIIAQDSKAGFEAVRWFAVKMANDGELCRRETGYEPKPMLKEDDLTMRIRPLDYNLLRGDVVRAITLGYRREIENEDEETDLGLAELNAKKAGAGV